MASPVAPDPTRARRRRGAGAVVVLVLGALAVAVAVTALTPRGDATIVAEPTPSASDPAGVEPDRATIYVHVLGAVAAPGLYLLRDGDRAVDAVAAAGGLVEGADPSGVNLARELVDGEQLRVPLVGEAVPPAAGSPGGAVAGGLVNLNTADVAALDTLPRIGPALAARIVAWRDAHGGFRAVEDLLEVSGIGQATLDGIADLVTV